MCGITGTVTVARKVTKYVFHSIPARFICKVHLYNMFDVVN